MCGSSSVGLLVFLVFEFTVPSSDCGIWSNHDPTNFWRCSKHADQTAVLQRHTIFHSACWSLYFEGHVKSDILWHLAILWLKNMSSHSVCYDDLTTGLRFKPCIIGHPNKCSFFFFFLLLLFLIANSQLCLMIKGKKAYERKSLLVL